MDHRALRVAPGLPALTDDSGTGNGTGKRALTGDETTLAEANARAALAEARVSIPQFEGRQLGRVDAERREFVALII
jgi:hypothetical protein